jgi:hypothetical protein
MKHKLTGIDKTTLETLGLTEEEYQERLDEWTDQLNFHIKRHRNILGNFIRNCFGNYNQFYLRRCSWRHVQLVRSDPVYSREVSNLLKKLPSDYGVATCEQQRYHLQHFFNTLMLAKLRSEEYVSHDQPRYEVTPNCQIEKDESTRLENLASLLNAWMQVIELREAKPRLNVEAVVLSLKELHDKFDRILNVLEP